MNQRRRLAVLSEHMESRLVLSPMAMLPIHGGGAFAEQAVAETPAFGSEVSERLADRAQVASQVSERISTVQNDASTQEPADGGTKFRPMTADDGASLHSGVDTNVNTDAIGVTADTSLTSGNDENIVGSHQSAGGTASLVADGGSRIPAASIPTAQSSLFESSPVSGDVVVKQEQRSAADVIVHEQNSADNEVSASPFGSSDTVTVPVTDSLSRVKNDSDASAPTSSSRLTTVSSAVGASTERSQEDSGGKLTNSEKGDASQTTDVRFVSPERQQKVVLGATDNQGRESADAVVVLDDTSRNASASNVSKVDSERRDVLKRRLLLRTHHRHPTCSNESM